jgi:hypothetical protein
MIFRRKLNARFHIEIELDFTRFFLTEPSNLDNLDPQIRLVKTSNGQPIPEDEPLFLMRGRNHLALPLLAHFQTLCAKDGCTEYQIQGNSEAIDEFAKFREEHPERMKQPGITRGL